MIARTIFCIFAITCCIVLGQSEKEGDGTYYKPAGGTGACGTKLQDNDMICALPEGYFKTVGCNKCLEVSNGKKKVVVKVMDKCAGCKNFDVDLSEAAFKQLFGDVGVGRAKVKSKVVACGSGGSAAPAAKKLPPSRIQPSPPIAYVTVVVTPS